MAALHLHPHGLLLGRVQDFLCLVRRLLVSSLRVRVLGETHALGRGDGAGVFAGGRLVIIDFATGQIETDCQIDVHGTLPFMEHVWLVQTESRVS